MRRLRPFVDNVLDRTVVPGYTTLGFRVRRTWWPDDDPRPGALAGKRALVTGAGSGLGQETALGLARLGAAVHLLVRDETKGQVAADAIAAVVPDAELHVEVGDMSDLSVVRSVADRPRRPGCRGSTCSSTTRGRCPPSAPSLGRRSRARRWPCTCSVRC